MPYTPGPWIWSDRHGICREGEAPYRFGDTVLCAKYEYGQDLSLEVSESDRLLILASPMMAEALEEIADHTGRHPLMVGFAHGSTTREEYKQAFAQVQAIARAALRLARGE